jgi:DNA repair protein RadC
MRVISVGETGAVVQLCPLLTPTGGFRPGPPAERLQVTTPDSALAVVRPLLAGHDRECGVLVALDTRHRVIGTTLISVGTAATTFLAPREVYRDALLLGASAIVVAHNHPSGDATPSTDDERITRRLSEAGATLGVDLLDHLVVGDPGWTSLARLGTGGL